MLRPRVGVRARVDQHRRPEACGNDDGDRRPQHAPDAPDVQQPGREHRAGVPRGHDGIGLSVADGTARGHQARVRLRPHRVRRLLVHLDHLGGLDEVETLGVEAGRTEDDDLEAVARRLDARPRSLRPAPGLPPGRRPLSAPLRGGSRQRLDVTALVRLAVRADVMRPLRPVADRALVHARRLEAMRRPALVAA